MRALLRPRPTCQPVPGLSPTTGATRQLDLRRRGAGRPAPRSRSSGELARPLPRAGGHAVSDRRRRARTICASPSSRRRVRTAGVKEVHPRDEPQRRGRRDRALHRRTGCATGVKRHAHRLRHAARAATSSTPTTSPSAARSAEPPRMEFSRLAVRAAGAPERALKTRARSRKPQLRGCAEVRRHGFDLSTLIVYRAELPRLLRPRYRESPLPLLPERLQRQLPMFDTPAGDATTRTSPEDPRGDPAGSSATRTRKGVFVVDKATASSSAKPARCAASTPRASLR